MLKRVSHHFPYCNEADIAYCGHRREDDEVGIGAPTCAFCAAEVDAEDRLDAEIAEMPLPLDAEEARELDPALNTGLPASVVEAARVVYACYFPAEARLFASRRAVRR